jgi:hypothetical protein
LPKKKTKSCWGEVTCLLEKSQKKIENRKNMFNHMFSEKEKNIRKKKSLTNQEKKGKKQKNVVNSDLCN